MRNENEVSKLLSESFDRELTAEEKHELQRHLESNDALKNFGTFLTKLRQVTTGLSTAGIEAPLERNQGLSAEKRLEMERALAQVARSETASAPAGVVQSQQQDVALAAALIAAGRMSSDQLSEAVADWSSVGQTSLRDHLLDRRWLAENEIDHFSQLAADTVRDQFDLGTVADSPDSAPDSAPDASLLEAADLLGVDAKMLARCEQRFETLAQYTIKRRLGGSLGDVYLAHDKNLDRTVALKTVSRSNRDKRAVLERFAREAKITGRLEHPNIVSIYHFGEDQQTGHWVYAMRFVGRRTLQDAIQEYHSRKAEGRADNRELRQLLTALMTVCQAIGFAHSKGVIHRDLKPQNVAIDKFDQITVIDWGLAKLVDEVDGIDAHANLLATSVSKTMDGQVLGTPLYMPPEQAAGDVEAVDQHSDIYGLGGILFEILTGDAPHARHIGSDPSSDSIDAMLSAIVKQPSPQVEVGGEVDAVLAAICNRALSKKKMDRFDRATDLCDAIFEWLTDDAKRLKRKEDLRSCIRHAESRLSSLCEDIRRNLRFISILPPVEGVMDAVSNRPDSEPLEVWRQRLEIIIEGLLRTNEEVLSISLWGLDSSTAPAASRTASEICAVQRQIGDPTLTHVVPASRLCAQRSTSVFGAIESADHGESVFSIVDQIRQRKSGPDKRYLQVALPIFDAGQWFGFVSMTVQLASSFSECFLSTVEDQSIQLWVFDQHAHPIFSSTSIGDTSWQPIESVSQFLASQDETRFESSQACGLRIHLNDHGIDSPDGPVHLNIIAIRP